MPKTTPNPKDAFWTKLGDLQAAIRAIAQQQTIIIQDSTRWGTTAPAPGSQPPVPSNGAQGAQYNDPSTLGPGNTAMIMGQLPSNLAGEYGSQYGVQMPQPNIIGLARPKYGIQLFSDTGALVFEVNQDQGLVVPSVSGYASLTGPGETATPGALTQLGDFEVSTGTGGTIAFYAGLPNHTGTIDVVTGTAGGINIETGSQGLFEKTSDNGIITLQADPAGAGQVIITAGEPVYVGKGLSFGTQCYFSSGSNPSVGAVFTVTSVSGSQAVAQWQAATFVPYASLTGTGESTSPGDLTQVGGFTVNEAGSTGIALNDSGAGGITLTDSGGTGISIVVTDATGPINIETSDASNTSGIGIGDMGTGGVYIQYNQAGLLSFFGAGPVVQPAAPASPTGGVVVDTQARAAIDSLIAILSTALGGNGLTA